jgi:Zn-dependent protease
MLRFRLGPIPVEVQPSHLIFSALLAYQGAPHGNFAAEGWPFQGLTSSGDPGFGRAVLGYVLAWMFIVFVSVLVHELGHAVASRLFGYQPAITLAWLGGHTQPNAPGPIPWKKDFALTLAGPLFGLALGAASYAGLGALRDQTTMAGFLLDSGATANLAWAVLNLIPILPLDGGRLTLVLSQRVFGAVRGFGIAQGLALLVAVLMVLLGLRLGAPFIFLIMFGLWGFQALQALVGLRNRTPREVPADHPLARPLRAAQEALRAGNLEEARRLAEPLLAEDSGAGLDLRSRVHHLLGWVCIKEGKGRAALDHFSQVGTGGSGRPVEAHALAAAFSLVGDEARALSLWELAWRESGDRTVLHEYAGSLIRAERAGEALRLPGVDPAAAFACAERVLFIRGAYSEAANVSEAALTHAPRPDIAYDAACAYARARNVRDALRLLERARELGFRDATYAASDEDLSPLHGEPGFESWLTAVRQSASG